MRSDPAAFLGQGLDSLREQKLYRHRRILEDEQRARTTFDHKPVVNLSSNNYLGLPTHPKLRQRMLDAIGQYGVGIEHLWNNTRFFRGGLPRLGFENEARREEHFGLCRMLACATRSRGSDGGQAPHRVVANERSGRACRGAGGAKPLG